MNYHVVGGFWPASISTLALLDLQAFSRSLTNVLKFESQIISISQEITYNNAVKIINDKYTA